MKRFICIAALALTSTLTAGPVSAQDVSISVNQPGLYGRIDLGGFSRPQLLYPQPVYVQRAPDRAPPPVYLHVPPGHEKHWRRHCAEYNACGQPVYFVRDDWYRGVYQPRYREVHGSDHRADRYGDGRDDDHRGERREERRDERHDERHDERRGDRHDHGER